MNIVRLANGHDIQATEYALRNRSGSISIYYTVNWSYFENLESICELAKEVKKDFPNITDKDITVHYLRLDNIDITALRVAISADEFQQLRNNYKLISL